MVLHVHKDTAVVHSTENRYKREPQERERKEKKNDRYSTYTHRVPSQDLQVAVCFPFQLCGMRCGAAAGWCRRSCCCCNVSGGGLWSPLHLSLLLSSLAISSIHELRTQPRQIRSDLGTRSEIWDWKDRVGEGVRL